MRPSQPWDCKTQNNLFAWRLHITSETTFSLGYIEVPLTARYDHFAQISQRLRYHARMVCLKDRRCHAKRVSRERCTIRTHLVVHWNNLYTYTRLRLLPSSIFQYGVHIVFNTEIKTTNAKCRRVPHSSFDGISSDPHWSNESSTTSRVASKTSRQFLYTLMSMRSSP